VAHPSAARRLARFAVGLELAEVPAPVVANATLLVLDTLGNALAASQEDFGRAALGVAARLGGPAESALIGTPGRVAAANAVLANATLAHGLDFDDTREGAIVHTGCVAVTTALAVGEAVAATGWQLLEALIAGVEVMCRVGLAVPGALHARHFHPSAIAGSFGAAAAAARLQNLAEEELVRAFGICGSQAGGIIEYLADGSWTKRLHPGWAAHAGVTARERVGEGGSRFERADRYLRSPPLTLPLPAGERDRFPDFKSRNTSRRTFPCRGAQAEVVRPRMSPAVPDGEAGGRGVPCREEGSSWRRRGTGSQSSC
jgi:2-methylcitrate dehydratase PrpD